MCRLFHLEGLRCVAWHGGDGKLHQMTVCIVQSATNPPAIAPHFGISRLPNVRTYLRPDLIRIRMFAM